MMKNRFFFASTSYFLILGLLVHSTFASASKKITYEFVDSDLKALLLKSKETKNQGLIYIWSPHMPLSIRGVKEAESLAHQKNMELTVLLDPYSEIEMSGRVAKKQKFSHAYTRRLESKILLDRDMTIHFPALILYKNGVLAREMRGGYDNPRRLAEYMDKMLSKIGDLTSVENETQDKGLFGIQVNMSKRTPAVASREAPSDENLICRFAPLGVIKRTAPRRATSYFFRTFPQSHFVSYAGVDDPSMEKDLPNHNYILNMDTRQEFQLPGPYDPVPICEDIMTVPADESTMKFFSINSILQKSQNSELGEIPMSGVYQSVTACPPGGKGEVKLITDQNGATMVRLKIDTSSTPPKIEMIGKPYSICTNVDLKFPMLAKDGNEISGRDEKDGTSKIWKIEADGTCKETFNFSSLLGNGDSKLLVGKSDFSFDGKKLVFHVRSDLDDGNYFEHASQTMAMNVYLYDREKKTLRKITNNFDRNSYYPVFKADGTIVYSDMTRQGQISFIWLDPKLSPESPVDSDYNEVTQKEQIRRYQALLTIGRTWYEFCANQKEPLQVDTAVLTALNLDEDDCKTLISKHWQQTKSEVISKSKRDHSARGLRYGKGEVLGTFDEAELMKHCPQGTRVTKEIDVLGDLDDTLILTAKGIIETKCMGCHQNKPFADAKILADRKDIVEKMIFRIFKAPAKLRMPYGGSLTPRELATLDSYLKAFLENKIVSDSSQQSQSAPDVQHLSYRKFKYQIRRPKDLPELELTK